MQYCFRDFERIRSLRELRFSLSLLFFFLPLLALVESVDVILLDLLEVVISAEHHFFAFKAQSTGVCGEQDLLDSVWALSFEGFDQVR